ncbi:hypothetical protein E2P61_01025 [Candidatus Bathyarchaeota archaeon]|nr:hypothetical protein E2P61_01025 [Candidatus Bathyarchaeota archaeon]
MKLLETYQTKVALALEVKKNYFKIHGCLVLPNAATKSYLIKEKSRWAHGILFIVYLLLVGDMNLVFDFNSSWYLLFSAFFTAWIILMVTRRKRPIIKEAKEQVFLAFSGMFALILMEFFAVSSNLWQYTPGNWPVILWPTYFAAILFGYQLLRSIEGFLHKPALLPEAYKKSN